MRPTVLAALPYPMQVIVGLIAYRKNSAALQGQGTGRYTPEELTELKKEVWDSINALLSASKKKGGKGKEGLFWLLGGEGPTEVDATLYGFVASALVCAASPETMSIVKSYPTIMDYANRVHKRYFPDYEKWE
ncbi:uncharacterized protein KY384_006775 [Bacidia gigantensis]|uniref:uncharacterized protein n=1 Tax=Bacidia gigantensis TaxID=2732470 RepID=UPI001D042FCB|nr:uncharacterized protein KY384_006775 [Bacidia gigantensis]KAG8527859.1 hypothetical protein KY384_006775 [Bacidia gigantensis]